MSITPSIVIERTEVERILNLFKQSKRVDGREFLAYRPIKVEIQEETGRSIAIASIGGTKVMSAIEIEFEVPYPDLPEEGVLTVNAELVPFVQPIFEFRPSSEVEIEIARIIDRIIRGSKAINLSKLCIIPGEKAYAVYIDLYALSNDGNLVDAFSLATLKALLYAKRPLYEVKGEKVRLKDEYIKLEIENFPLTISFAEYEGKLLIDPCLKEEEIFQSKLVIGIDKDGKICTLQKSGIRVFTPSLIKEAIKIAKIKAEELRNFVLK